MTFSIRRKGRSICKGELHLFHRGPAGTPSALSNGWKQTPSQRYSADHIDIPDDLEPRDAMQRGPSTRTRETRRPWLGRDHGISREVYGVFCTPWGCNETRIVFSRAISARPQSESKRGSPSLCRHSVSCFQRHGSGRARVTVSSTHERPLDMLRPRIQDLRVPNDAKLNKPPPPPTSGFTSMGKEMSELISCPPLDEARCIPKQLPCSHHTVRALMSRTHGQAKRPEPGPMSIFTWPPGI